MPHEMWDEITYPSPDFNVDTVVHIDAVIYATRYHDV